MSNRNFDSRVIIQRLRDKNLAQNFAQFQQNSGSLINNPQTSDPSPQRIGQYYDGAGTAYAQNLLGGGYTVDLGATANLISSGPFTVPPSPPTSLSTTSGDASLSVAFTTGNLGTGSLINYEYSIDGGVTFTAFSPAQTTSPVTISGLTNGTTYTIALKTVTTDGTSTPSSTTSGTPATTPDAPTITGITAGNQQLSIAFTAPPSDGGSAVTNYEYSTDNGSTFTAVSPSQTSSPIVITGLTNGTTYSVQLRAVNVVGSGTASATSTGTPITTPDAPTITGIAADNQQLSVAFTAPEYNGGSVITNYEYSTDTGSTFTAVSPAQTSSPIVITGLTNGTTYSVQLRAVNVAGPGTASATSTGTPVTVPSAPSSLSATPGNTTASISFTQTSTGGSPITNYLYSTDGSTYTALSPADTTSPVTITGLTNGVTYTIYLKAVNAIGQSTASSPVSVTPANIPSGNMTMLIMGDASVTSVKSYIQTAITSLGYGGTITMDTQQLNGYTGTTLSSYDIALIYTNGGLNLNATLGTNLNTFVSSGKHLIMMGFSWGNVSAISSFDYTNNSTYAFNGTYTSTATNTLTYVNTPHPITTGLSASTGVGSQNVPSPITLTSGATDLANYSNGTSFLAVKTQGSANLVGINLYPQNATNLFKFVVNSMYWCMGYLT